MAEAEVSVLLAEYLLEQPAAEQVAHVAIDGASVRIRGINGRPDQVIFNPIAFLAGRGWVQSSQAGKNSWTGVYRRGPRELVVHSRSGEADVLVTVGGRRVLAECKKGPLMAKKGSPERPLLAHALGQALCLAVREGDLAVAAVPDSLRFQRLAESFRLNPLLRRTGIQIALVARDGRVSGLIV